MTGPTMPFDAFTGDTIHQYFQMVQQVDCAIDAEHVSRDNPTGCLHDLQSAITTTYSTPPDGHAARHRADHGLLQHAARRRAAFQVARRQLHDERQLSPAGAGRHGSRQPAARLSPTRCSSATATAIPQRRRRPTSTIPIRRPARSTSTRSARSGSIAPTTTQPGIAAITRLPEMRCPTPCQRSVVRASIGRPSTSIRPSRRRALLQSGLVVPPTTQQSIGDVLSAHNISWKYYGGGFNADGTTSPFNGSYCNICNPFEYESNYPDRGRRSHARRDRSVHRSQERHPAGGLLREARRHDGRPSRVLEVDALRGLREEHHRARAEQPAAMGRDRDLRHRGRRRRLLRLGIHPAGGFLRHRPAHSDDRRVAVSRPAATSATSTTSIHRS